MRSGLTKSDNSNILNFIGSRYYLTSYSVRHNDWRLREGNGGEEFKLAKARIMVVDDESIVRMDIKEMLIEEGYSVVAEASDGEAAVEQALRHRPDLIVMDVKMPRMNGLKAGRIIYQKTGIPLLALTAYSHGQLVQEAKTSGIIAYLVKPVTESDLLPSLEIALAQAEQLKRMNAEIADLKQTIVNRKLVERAKGILMEQYQLNERTAYGKMRSFSMARRVTMEELAHTIIQQGSFPE